MIKCGWSTRNPWFDEWGWHKVDLRHQKGTIKWLPEFTRNSWSSVVRGEELKDCVLTFTKTPLQQVMFGLQFGDEITALQILPEFLWRNESNYTLAMSTSQHPSALKTAIGDWNAKGKRHAESLFKAVIRARPSLDWNRRATNVIKQNYFKGAAPLPTDQIFWKELDAWEEPRRPCAVSSRF